MRIIQKCLLLFGLSALLFPTQATFAGPYTDDLSKCIIESTTLSDRTAFVRWMFFAASLHPAVKSISAVSQGQLDAANKQTAELIMKLLTESCPQKVEKALKYEGKSAFETSFAVLGQLAGQELFSSPEVTAGMEGLTKYLDAERLKSTFVGN